MSVAATTVETVVDDGEGLSSFCASLDPGEGYFCISIENGKNVIYCELNDQSLGFYSETVKYESAERKINFWTSGDEYFDRSDFINEIEVVIPDMFDMEEIGSCLKFIFDMADANRRSGAPTG
jgi:hypothetical protein